MRVSLQYEYCDGYQLYLYLQRRMRLLDVLGKHGNFISFITILRLYKPDVLLDEYLFVQYRENHRLSAMVFIRQHAAADRRMHYH